MAGAMSSSHDGREDCKEESRNYQKRREEIRVFLFFVVGLKIFSKMRQKLFLFVLRLMRKKPPNKLNQASKKVRRWRRSASSASSSRIHYRS